MTTAITACEIAGFPALRAQAQPTGQAHRPTLLFLHGAFVTHEPFAPWMEMLAQAGFSSIAVARRGRLGIGPEHARDLSFADYLDDTLRVLDTLPEPPIVVGHSLGGLLAQKVAELGRVRAAVLLAPAPAAMLSAQPVALPAYLPMLPKILTGQPLVPSCNACERIALNRIPQAARAQIHERLVHESGKVYRELIFGTVHVDAGRVTCPVYVTGGEDDRIVSQALLRFTAQRYGAELRVLAGHGHWLIEEPGWESIVSEVQLWLEHVSDAQRHRAA